jgi:hypothetical protein
LYGARKIVWTLLYLGLIKIFIALFLEICFNRSEKIKKFFKKILFFVLAGFVFLLREMFGWKLVT